MARLIVEEGGKRRAFKLGDGVLTIGTGAEARLKVSAPDVAEVHAEIQLQGAGAVLRPRPGVLPPTVGGEPVAGETAVAFGVEVRIGSVRVWLEDEAQPAGAAAPPPAASAAAAPGATAGASGVAVSGAERAVKREQAIAKAKAAGNRSKVQRSRPRVQKGIPGSVLALLLLGGAAVAGFAGWKVFQAEASGPPPIQATFEAIRADLAGGALKTAEDQLTALQDSALSAEEADVKRELVAELAALKEQAAIDREHMIGTRFLDTKLKKYQEYYLQGAPSEPKARVFLKRCREFRERWPKHPERDWVNRQEKRFLQMVDLSQPPTLADIEWEVECLTKTSPKLYGEAFALLDGYIETASGFDLEAAQVLRGELVEARKTDHRDRMLQAQYEFEQKQDGVAAAAELIYVIMRYGDEDMTNEAATYLLKLPDLTPKLKGWQADRPADWAELVKHPMVAKYARENGLL